MGGVKGMADLAQLQDMMGQAVREGQASELLLDAIVDQGLMAEERLQVHVNTYRESLVSALNGVFPLSEAFVGKVFIREALRQFVLMNPPKEPMLFRYGEDFPEFFKTYKAAEAVPYISDLARLEWLTHELMHAREDAWAEAEECDDVGGLALGFGTKFLRSNFPVFDLWRVATGQLQPEKVDIDSGGQAMLIHLNEGQVFYHLMGPEVAASLGRALGEKIVSKDDLSVLSDLIEQGLFFAP